MFTNNLIRRFLFLTNSNTKSSALYHLIMRRYYRATLLSILQQFLLFFNTNNASRQYLCSFEQCNLSILLFFIHAKSSLLWATRLWTLLLPARFCGISSRVTNTSNRWQQHNGPVNRPLGPTRGWTVKPSEPNQCLQHYFSLAHFYSNLGRATTASNRLPQHSEHNGQSPWTYKEAAKPSEPVNQQ